MNKYIIIFFRRFSVTRLCNSATSPPVWLWCFSEFALPQVSRSGVPGRSRLRLWPEHKVRFLNPRSLHRKWRKPPPAFDDFHSTHSPFEDFLLFLFFIYGLNTRPACGYKNNRSGILRSRKFTFLLCFLTALLALFFFRFLSVYLLSTELVLLLAPVLMLIICLLFPFKVFFISLFMLIKIYIVVYVYKSIKK